MGRIEREFVPMSSPSFLTIPDRLGLPDGPLRERVWQLLCELRVALPCIVQSFDSVKQTVSVRPTVMERLNKYAEGVPIPTDTDIGVIDDVPIMPFRAGGFVLTMPVQAGDECLVVFADMDMSSWWAKGGVLNLQEDRRRHDLSDGFAILGPCSKPNAVPNYSATAAELRSLDGAVTVSVKPGEIDITAPVVKVMGATEVDVSSSTLVNINGSGHTTIEGKNFLTHQHTGVQAGGANSGPVV